ncbi:class I SAM-dependent methyltransferase [Deminuibacter soli]|uniref:Class I SAM-dependent methyltransferase n=1 Tax=Deminuibacter soli TaxID=2291815 RepID=A0A3E1NKV5_9BACT|nr:class I SAM-dependent methyltransferase [Deminuibacter soli]RFM28552.1 class I SAM-dependent methyltransferase [Deminuibacter soli]
MAIQLLDPQNARSFNQGFRAKRFAFFKSLLPLGEGKTIRILDVGGTESYWERMGFTTEQNVHITLLNLETAPVRYSNFSSVKGNACNMSEYEDGHFDIVFSNSVIEHLFTWENQQKMAEEIRRVGKCYYVQTPNYYFPLEPHWFFPFFQFLPFRLRVWLTQRFNLGHYPKSITREAAIKRVEEVKLLTEAQMKVLFPDGKVYREKLFGLTKSVTLYSFPTK